VAPRPPRLHLSPIRSSESVELDGKTLRPYRSREGYAVPPYEGWGKFRSWFGREWNADPDYGAEHVVLVGAAGSGKTTLAREILRFRDYVCVLGTKARDPSLYDPLVKQGYEIVDKFDPKDIGNPKVIFRPRLLEPTKEAIAEQKEAFRRVLVGIFATGGWTIYMDEVRYLTETLGLQSELNTLWLQGRSLNVTMVASTQRPVSVPLNAFEQATHAFLFRITGHDDRKRASEYMGTSAPIVNETVSRLPHHEFLYVNSTEDILVRSKVDR
jgi:hypothetical protein